MIALIKRNLLLYFRDKGSVAVSLISVFVVIGIYFLFLGEAAANGLYAIETFESRARARLIVGGLFMGGAIAVAALTTSLQALGRMVEDRQQVLKDITISPVSQTKITLSYIISSAVVGMIMSFIVFIFAYVYLTIRGLPFIGFGGIGLIFLTTFLTVLCACSMMYFIVMFIKSRGAFTAVNSIFGVGGGFLMGAFIMIGMMPTAVQWLIKLFPLSHSVSMFRIILAQSEIEYGLANDPYWVERYQYDTGIMFDFAGFTSTFWFSAGILVATTVLFFGLSLLAHRFRKSK